MSKGLPKLPAFKPSSKASANTQHTAVQEELTAESVIVLKPYEDLNDVVASLKNGDVVIKGGIQFLFEEGKFKKIGRGSRVIQRLDGADYYTEDNTPVYDSGDYQVDDVENISMELNKFFD